MLPVSQMRWLSIRAGHFGSCGFAAVEPRSIVIEPDASHLRGLISEGAARNSLIPARASRRLHERRRRDARLLRFANNWGRLANVAMLRRNGGVAKRVLQHRQWPGHDKSVRVVLFRIVVLPGL